MEKGRIIGLDFGKKTVGVSVTDPLQLTARSLCTVRRERENKLRQTLSEISSIIKEQEADLVILGLPLNMDGSEGERCEKTREFKALLEKRTDARILFFDERLTTEAAYETLKENGVSRDKWEELIDSVSAVHILNGYLSERDKTIE